jgi:anti-sigma-K factor RskA
VNCEEFRDNLELYVAGALPPDESRSLEQHAVSCSSCAGELIGWSVVTEGLARAASPESPSLSLRSRILSRIEPRAASPAVSRSSWGAWLAAAALFLIAVGLGADSLRLRRELRVLEQTLSAERARARASEALVARLQTAGAQQTLAMTVLTAPDLARIDLAGQTVAPHATARAFWSRSRGMVFSASAMPPLPAGRTYQLWAVTASAPVSVGLLEPDTSGRMQGVFTTPPNLTPVAIALTLEPAGGVPSPTGEKYLVGVPSPSI